MNLFLKIQTLTKFSLKKDFSKESSQEKQRSNAGFASTKGTRNFNINLLKAQQRIMRTQKNMNSSSEKSRNIRIVKSSTSKRDRNLGEIERQILSVEEGFSIDKIKVLSEAFRSVTNQYLTDAPHQVVSLLNLINHEFSNMFQSRSKGRKDSEVAISDNNFASTLHNVKDGYEKAIQNQKTEYENKIKKLNKDHLLEIRKLKLANEKMRKEKEEVKVKCEAEMETLKQKTKEKNDEVFLRMKDYINNELGK